MVVMGHPHSRPRPHPRHPHPHSHHDHQLSLVVLAVAIMQAELILIVNHIAQHASPTAFLDDCKPDSGAHVVKTAKP